jgi:hypothetical protein
MQRRQRSLWTAVLGLAVLLGLLAVRPARADSIPYGAANYSERVAIGVRNTLTDETIYANVLEGSPDLAETFSDSWTIFEPDGGPPVGTARGFAQITAGTATTAPSVLMQAEAVEAFFEDADVNAFASVLFQARLIKLHPDAPDDIPIPIQFTSSLSGVGSLTIGSEGTTLFSQNALGGAIDIDSSFSLLPFQGIGVDLSASTGGTLFGSAVSLEGAGTSPVFSLDPSIRVPFGTEPGRTESIADLYTLAYPEIIGFAGNFATVTPLDDGCLGDPGLLAPGGGPAVTNGASVACKKVDPSGFRTYGNELGDPLGILNDLQITVEEDALVLTDVDGNVDPDGAATFGLLGSGNSITNEGRIRALGEVSNAIFSSGDSFDLVNRGLVDTLGEESEVVWIIGDEAGVVNEGEIRSLGLLSSGVVIEGDGAFVSNAGTVSTEGLASSGIVIEGNEATFENTGSIDTAARFSAGVVLLGNDSVGDVVNRGAIETQESDAWGIVALGQGHDLVNVGPASGAGGRITTSGARSHGIALGLQEVVLPPGVALPPEALLPASGSLENAGAVATSGDDADALHALANGLAVTNTGQLTATGSTAHGISVEGTDAVVTNAEDGEIQVGEAGGGTQGNRGIDIVGDRGRVTNAGAITVDSDDGAGVRVEGAMAVVSHAGPAAEIDATGDSVHAIEVASDTPLVVNEGTVRASGADAAGIGVTAGVGSAFQVTSSGDLTVEGIGARGIMLSGVGAAAAPAAGPTAACVVSGDGGGKLVNCGVVTATNSDLGVGMEATGIRDATVENQGQIVASGVGVRGISVTSAAPSSGDRNNLISNVDLVDVDGPNAVGIELNGDGNLLLQGNGGIDIPNAPFEDPKDLQDVFGRELFPLAASYSNEFSRDAPAGTVIPVGRVRASGTSAIGVSVTGENNLVGQTLSGQADASTIEARGAGAIGVKLEGDGNLFVNGGVVIGDGIGIQGGAGRDSVANLNRVEGGIDLAGGLDRLVVGAASEIVGTATGGADRDELIFFVPEGDSKPIDGDQYQSFEDLWKLGAGELVVSNTLRGDVLLMEVGELEVAAGGRVETSDSSIHVREGARLSGDGTAAGRVVMEGGVLAPGGEVGSLTLEGDLVFESGVLEIQLGGSDPGASDLLEVLGSVSFLDGELLLSLEGGFLPELGQTIDFLSAISVAGLDNLGLDVAGLPMGYAFDVTSTADGLRLVTTAIPEPSALLLTAMGLAGLALDRRRSTRSEGRS